MSSEDNSEQSQSQESSQEQAPSVDEIVKNTRAELHRKTSNLEQQLAETNQRLAAMMEAVTKANQQPAASGKSAKDLLYDDPDAFVSSIEARAAAKAEERVQRERESQAAMQNVIVQMQSDFPEFASPGSEAAKLAIDLAAKLPARLRGTAEGAELAMSKAAAQLGLAPVSKRQGKPSTGDDFVAGSKTSGSAGSQASKKSTKVDEKTLAFAQLMGIDINDKKRLEGLQKASERKNWKSYT